MWWRFVVLSTIVNQTGSCNYGHHRATTDRHQKLMLLMT